MKKEKQGKAGPGTLPSYAFSKNGSRNFLQQQISALQPGSSDRCHRGFYDEVLYTRYTSVSETHAAGAFSHRRLPQHSVDLLDHATIRRRQLRTRVNISVQHSSNVLPTPLLWNTDTSAMDVADPPSVQWVGLLDLLFLLERHFTSLFL
jgi:hypothetical protein